MNHGTLIFFCGKMGAGKSTLSQKVAKESHALLISEDAWLAAHYPDMIHAFEDYLRYASRIKPFVRELVKNAIASGVNVVMDFPANTSKQRRWFLDLCKEINCHHEMYFLNASDNLCLAQLKKRNREQPERVLFDNEAMFHKVTKYFETPSKSEGLNIIKGTKKPKQRT